MYTTGKYLPAVTAESLPAAVQWLGVMLLGAIPFVESCLGSIVGILAGVHPVIAIVAATLDDGSAVVWFTLQMVDDFDKSTVLETILQSYYVAF